MQQYAVYILFSCKITLHVSGFVHTHHQEYIKLRYHWYKSWTIGHVGVR